MRPNALQISCSPAPAPTYVPQRDRGGCRPHGTPPPLRPVGCMRGLGATAGASSAKHLAGFQPIAVQVPEREEADASPLLEALDRHPTALELGMESRGVGRHEDGKWHTGPARREHFPGFQLPEREAMPVERQ